MEVSGNHRQPDEPGNAILGYTGNRRFHLLEGCRKSCQYNYEESFPPGLLFFPRSRLRSKPVKYAPDKPHKAMPTIPSGAADRHGHYTDIPCVTASPKTPHTCNRHATLQISFRPAQPAGRPGSLLGHESPGIPDIPRDASAAAIMASALYELRTYVSAEDGNRYQSIADKIVDSLNRHSSGRAGNNLWLPAPPFHRTPSGR